MLLLSSFECFANTITEHKVVNEGFLIFFLFQAMVEEVCVGAIVCKLDMHKKMFRRGYIAMLAVDSEHRRKNIGEVLCLQVNDRVIVCS